MKQNHSNKYNIVIDSLILLLYYEHSFLLLMISHNEKMISSITIIHKLKIKKQKRHQIKKLKIIIYIITYIKIILGKFDLEYIELNYYFSNIYFNIK